MPLKPQDVLVALKLATTQPAQATPLRTIATAIGLSVSETHAALNRLRAARLIAPQDAMTVNRAALEEFLVHGIKYAFPAERGEPTRGMPTAYAAPPLKQFITPTSDPPPVWPDPAGDTRGIALSPLYRTAPAAARRDTTLYELLAIIDALREGRAREREIAVRELHARLYRAA